MGNFNYKEQTFSHEDDKGNSVTWNVVDIIEHTKHIKPKLVNLDQFKGYLDYVIKGYSADDWERVDKADLSFPILVGVGSFKFSEDPDKGARYPLIFDGVHRLVKAVRLGYTYLPAIVTDTLPDPVVIGKGIKLDKMKYRLNKNNGLMGVL